MTFDQLGLSAEILRAIHDQGYTDPTPIQAQAIPPILNGKDIMGGAQTGTGKTASFTLPMLHRLQPYASTSVSPARHPIRSLILVPTRERASTTRNNQSYVSVFQVVRRERVKYCLCHAIFAHWNLKTDRSTACPQSIKVGIQPEHAT